MTWLDGWSWSTGKPGGTAIPLQKGLFSQGSSSTAMKSRVRRESQARFCERLEVKSLRPTRPGGGFGCGAPGDAEGHVEGGGAGRHRDLFDRLGRLGAEQPPRHRRLVDVVAGVVEEVEADAAALLELHGMHVGFNLTYGYIRSDANAGDEDASHVSSDTGSSGFVGGGDGSRRRPSRWPRRVSGSASQRVGLG